MPKPPTTAALLREARKIAKGQVLAALEAKSLRPADLKEGTLEDLIVGLISRRPEIGDEARRRLDAERAASASLGA